MLWKIHGLRGFAPPHLPLKQQPLQTRIHRSQGPTSNLEGCWNVFRYTKVLYDHSHVLIYWLRSAIALHDLNSSIATMLSLPESSILATWERKILCRNLQLSKSITLYWKASIQGDGLRPSATFPRSRYLRLFQPASKHSSRINSHHLSSPGLGRPATDQHRLDIRHSSVTVECEIRHSSVSSFHSTALEGPNALHTYSTLFLWQEQLDMTMYEGVQASRPHACWHCLSALKR